MNNDCQQDINDLVQTYAICVVAIAVWSIAALSAHCCCLSFFLEGAPGLAAQFFGVVGAFQVGMVVYTVTIFFPYCPESCRGNCPDDELGWFYLVPALEGVIGLCWLRASWNRAVVAKALRRSINGDDNDNGGEAAIFTKLPASEDDADATEMELTENSNSSGMEGDHHEVMEVI